MWPELVSNPGPLALESDALPTTPRGPASFIRSSIHRVHLELEASS